MYGLAVRAGDRPDATTFASSSRKSCNTIREETTRWPNNMDALEWLRKHLDAEGDAEAVMAQTLAQVSYNQQPKTIW
jgi:hypothetical protein